jgi:hypothetical protein
MGRKKTIKAHVQGTANPLATAEGTFLGNNALGESAMQELSMVWNNGDKERGRGKSIHK